MSLRVAVCSEAKESKFRSRRETESDKGEKVACRRPEAKVI